MVIYHVILYHGHNIATGFLEIAKKYQEGRVAKSATAVAIFNFTEGGYTMLRPCVEPIYMPIPLYI